MVKRENFSTFNFRNCPRFLESLHLSSERNEVITNYQTIQAIYSNEEMYSLHPAPLLKMRRRKGRSRRTSS